jgi:hypothetical protein
LSHEGLNNKTNDEHETLKANLKDLEIADKKLADENTRMKKVLEVTNTTSVNAEKEMNGLKEINENLVKDLKVLNLKLYSFVPDLTET